MATERKSDRAGTLARSDFGVTVLGVLFALTFRAALERGLGGVADYQTIDAIRQSFVSTPRQHIFALLQLFAFLLTLFRFYAGAYRFNTSRPPALDWWAVAWNIANTSFLFVGLYVAALLVKTTGLFLLFVASFHAIDLIWFGLGGPLLRGSLSTEKAKDYFILFDTATLGCAGFVGLWWLVRPFDTTWMQLWSAVILIAMFVLDVLWLCRSFYFNPAEWEAAHRTNSPETPAQQQKIIYLAGPLFTQGERSWNANIASALHAAGYKVLLPQEQAGTIVKSSDGLTPEERQQLFLVAIDSVRRADAVVAVLDGPDADSGTCFECGVAYAVQKPVVGVRTDLRLAGDDEERSTNLMLGQSCRDYVLLGIDGLVKDHTFASEQIVAALRRIGV